jgi:hypothetical protein
MQSKCQKIQFRISIVCVGDKCISINCKSEVLAFYDIVGNRFCFHFIFTTYNDEIIIHYCSLHPGDCFKLYNILDGCNNSYITSDSSGDSIETDERTAFNTFSTKSTILGTSHIIRKVLQAET